MMHNIQFYLLYGVTYLLSLLPMWVHYRLSDLLRLVIFYVVRYRRKNVRRNLENSFPEKTAKEIDKIEHEFYKFLCDYIVENLKLLSMRKQNVMRRMVFEGLDDVVESFKEHDIVLIYLGHYGNWEYIASLQWWVPSDIHCAQLYSPLHNEAFDRLFYKLRGRYGGENINKHESLRHIMNYRVQGQKAIVGFIADQTPKWENIHLWMDFLGQDTPVFTGAERIARKLDAAVYYADVSHPKRGYYRCRMKKLTDHAHDMEEHQLTKVYMQELEKTIRETPFYWLWTHNRWKRRRDAQNNQKTQEE